ncbi:MAG: TonB family protein [Bacteroidales bacterium]|nr:TonB family protein [Bacteroidales bacterium]
MGKNKNISLFLASGCITPETIRLYNDGELAGEDLKKVDRHLEGCPLCKEAVEGYKLIPDHLEQGEAVQEIRKELFSLINKKRELSPGEMKIRRVYKYVAAAASVIIIAGIFSIYHFVLKQDNNMIADNIEAKKAVPETISEKQFQPVTPVQQPKEKGKGVDPKKDEIVTIEKQEEIEEPEVLAEEVKSDIKGKISRQVSAVQIRDTESDDAEKDVFLTDEVQAYKISGVEAPEEKGRRKSAVAGVAVQPEPVVFDNQSEIQPQFIVEEYKDFNDYIRKNIRYPEAALAKGISGNVKVEFFVNKKGKVIKVSVVEGIDEIINDEALRVVSSSPRWIAAEINGERITRKMIVTVEFHHK